MPDEDREAGSIFDALTQAPEDHAHSMAVQVLAFLQEDPVEDWNNPPMLMGFVEHKDHLDRVMISSLVEAEGDEDLLPAIKLRTEQLREMLVQAGKVDRPTVVTMALVAEAWLAPRRMDDPNPPKPGDRPQDEEARICYAATVGGGWSQGAYIRSKDAYVEKGEFDSSGRSDSLFHTMSQEVQDALHELLAVANGKE